MSLEEKISYLESLKNNGVNLKYIPLDYVSKDGVIVNNVIMNIKKYFNKNLMTVKQIIECENLGIVFEPKKNDEIYKINYLNKAIEEGYDLTEISVNRNKYEQNSILWYVLDLRNKYEQGQLTEVQVDKCINDLKIVVSDKDKKEILLKK